MYFLMTLIFGLYEGFDLNSFISDLNVHKETIKHNKKEGGILWYQTSNFQGRVIQFER